MAYFYFFLQLYEAWCVLVMMMIIITLVSTGWEQIVVWVDSFHRLLFILHRRPNVRTLREHVTQWPVAYTYVTTSVPRLPSPLAQGAPRLLLLLLGPVAGQSQAAADKRRGKWRRRKLSCQIVFPAAAWTTVAYKLCFAQDWFETL